MILPACDVGIEVIGVAVVGFAVVGIAVVGIAVVGIAVVGIAVVGIAVVGRAVVGRAVVGRAVVGRAVVGIAVVGRAVVGREVVGDAVVGGDVVETPVDEITVLEASVAVVFEEFCAVMPDSVGVFCVEAVSLAPVKSSYMSSYFSKRTIVEMDHCKGRTSVIWYSSEEEMGLRLSTFALFELLNESSSETNKQQEQTNLSDKVCNMLI
jgi:hypothetical protein